MLCIGRQLHNRNKQTITSDKTCPVFIACVYMPCDMGDHDSLENFMCTCCKLNSLYDESDVVHAIIAGDFNCQSGSRFF